MRYFIRQSVMDLLNEKRTNVAGVVDLFSFQDQQITNPDNVSIGEEKLVEIIIHDKQTGEKL